MIIDKQKIIQLLDLGESENLEIKTSFSKAIIETIVAFSNTSGGTIILGCNDKKKVIGISINDESIQNWINEIKQSIEPSIFPTFTKSVIDGKTVISITVDEFPLKPITYKDRCFVRRQNSNHKMSVDEIEEMRFISLNYSFGAYEVESNYDALQKDALLFFEQRILQAGRYLPAGDLKRDLVKLNIVKDNGRLTRAAELLFGEHHTCIHMGRFKSQTTIIDDLMIRKPLLLAVEEALDFIKKNIRLEFEFGQDGLKRKENWQYPIPALRELLLNAIVHRDYSNPTDVIIKIFDDNIEITNPGKLMGGLTIEDLKSDNYIPKHRNKLLTEAFYLTGDIEKYGTGFKRIKDWLKEYPNLTLELDDLNDFFCVTIHSKNITRVNEGVNEGVNLLYHLIKTNPHKRTPFFVEELKTSVKPIERWVSALRKQNKIEFIGNSKTGGYVAK